MKCFLHIGTDKTGTTTLQNFFHENREQLRNSGYVYTKSLGYTNNIKLPIAAYDLDMRDDTTDTYGLHSSEKLSDFQKATIIELKEEINTISRNNKNYTIIFSSEHIQSRLKSITSIKRLKRILLGVGISEIQVIVYLRRPADIANSLYSTNVKGGRVLPLSEKTIDKLPAHVSNHKNTLLNFSEVFGDEYVVPRLYCKKELINQSIVDDFLYLMGLPLDSRFHLPGDQNETLSTLGVELFRRINKIVPMWLGGKINPVRADLVKYFESNFSDGKYIMPSEKWVSYDAAFYESNEWVRRRYFPDKAQLFSTHIPKEEEMNLSERELDTIARFVGSIWTEKQSNIQASICGKIANKVRKFIKVIRSN